MSKEKNNSVQSKDKLKFIPSYTYEFSKGVWVAHVYLSGMFFCKVIGETKKQSEDNAKKIVKAMNMHNELIEALKLWTKCNGSTDWARSKRSSMENQAYDKTLEVLKKSEQK